MSEHEWDTAEHDIAEQASPRRTYDADDEQAKNVQSAPRTHFDAAQRNRDDTGAVEQAYECVRVEVQGGAPCARPVALRES